MRDRYTRVGRRTDRAGDSRDDFDRKTSAQERLDLLAAAPEDEWVAAFEPDNPLSGAHVLDERGVDLILGERHRSRRLARVDNLGLRAALREKPLGAEPVGHDDIRFPEKGHATNRDETRIARTGSHEIGDARCGHEPCLV